MDENEFFRQTDLRICNSLDIEKGAFTGTIAQKRERFERANGGTFFLVEVAELPLQVQVRLLRVLQSKEIERVGGE